MPVGLLNGARVKTATAGAGPYTTGAAVAGCITFAQAGAVDGGIYPCGILDGNAWEDGLFQYSATGPTLTRLLTFRSSGTGNNTALSLSGNAEIYCDVPAEMLLPTRKPGGRLSLTPGVPVQTADVVGATSIYYLPFEGNNLPGLPGAFTIPDAGLTLALDSNAAHAGYQQAGHIYDIFTAVSAGAVMGTGPAWASLSARGTGAGTTELQWIGGLPFNKNSITLKIDATATTITVPAGQASCIGSMYATANGQCSAQFNPAPAAGGSGTLLCLFNAFHRQPCFATSRDSTANWTYASGTFRNANASSSNRIWFLDGLGVIPTFAQYIANATSADSNNTGVCFNTTGIPDLTGSVQGGGASEYSSVTPFAVHSPVLGLNYWQAVESGTLQMFGTDSGQNFQSLLMGGQF